MLILVKGATLGLSGALSPGPLQAYLLAQSARQGPWRALPLALVPLVTDPVIIATVLAVLSRLPPAALVAMRLGGGAFVIWLGVNALLALRRRPAGGPAVHAPPVGFVRAAIVNITNPNAWGFWIAVGGPTLAGFWRESPGRGAGFLAAFYLALCGGNAALVFLFGELGQLGPRAARALAAASACLLLFFGAWQLRDGLLG